MASHTEVTVRTLKTHLHKPGGTVASKYRQNIASIDLLLQIFYDVLLLWACPERCWREERREEREGFTSGLESEALTQQDLRLFSLSHKAQKSRTLYGK